MIDATQILKEYRITEKASGLTANLNQYTFEVARDANRHQIAEAIERTFHVKVARVNVLNTKPRLKRSRLSRGALGRKSSYKKAIVTLQEGMTIELV